MECTDEVIAVSDFVGSTSEIIDFATNTDCEKFIICTEMGVFFELQERNPDKKFCSVGHRQFCPNMKKVTLDKVEQALESMTSTVELPDDIIVDARKPLQRMLELSQQYVSERAEVMVYIKNKKKKGKVVVGMSGGVDSLLPAYLFEENII